MNLQDCAYKTHYKSRVLDKNYIWKKTVADQISDFSEEEYQKLKALILEQGHSSIQKPHSNDSILWKTLTKW